MNTLHLKQIQNKSSAEQVLAFTQKTLRPLVMAAMTLTYSVPAFADSISFKRNAFGNEQEFSVQSSVVKPEGDWLFVEGVSRSDYDFLYRNLKDSQQIDNFQLTSGGTVSFKIALSALQGIKITDCSGKVYGLVRPLKDRLASVDCEVGKYSDTGTTADELGIEERTKIKAQEQAKAEQEKARQEREQEELKRRLQPRLDPFKAGIYGLAPGFSGIYNPTANTVVRIGEVGSLFIALSFTFGRHETSYSYNPNLLAYNPDATNGTPLLSYTRTDTHSMLFPNLKITSAKYDFGMGSSIIGNQLTGALIDNYLAQKTFDRSLQRYNQRALGAWAFYSLWTIADIIWSIRDSKSSEVGQINTSFGKIAVVPMVYSDSDSIAKNNDSSALKYRLSFEYHF